MGRGEIDPGVSDIDLLLLVEDGADLCELSPVRDSLRRVFPVLGDLWIGTQEEYRRYLQWGGSRAVEDPPTWKTLAGEPIASDVKNLQSEAKRPLNAWHWCFVSLMELSRRLFLPSEDPKGKKEADSRKLFADVIRYAEAARGRALKDRRTVLSSLPATSLERMWAKAGLLLDGASYEISDTLGLGEGEVPPRYTDLPYHVYRIFKGRLSLELLDNERRAVERQRADAVPLVISEKTWSLLVRSAYPGAPLGRFEDSGAHLADLSWECAAEAASWFCLWRRAVWIDEAFPNRFALKHLYTRAAGLRLLLCGHPVPFDETEALFERSADLFKEDAPLYRSIARFLKEEPAACLEGVPRRLLAPEHEKALDVLSSRLAQAIDARRKAATCLSASH